VGRLGAGDGAAETQSARGSVGQMVHIAASFLLGGSSRLAQPAPQTVPMIAGMCRRGLHTDVDVLRRASGMKDPVRRRVRASTIATLVGSSPVGHAAKLGSQVLVGHLAGLCERVSICLPGGRT